MEVLLEDMNSKIGVIAEQSVQHTKDIGEVKSILEKHGERLDTIEVNIEFIKHELRSKIDRDEFAALETRVTRLESRP